MTNLTHNSFICIYFNSLHVTNCINTTSGICHSVSVTVSCAGAPAKETVIDTERHKPDVVLIQLVLLMMSTRLLETCREMK